VRWFFRALFVRCGNTESKLISLMLAKALADRVAFLEEGGILADAPPAVLVEHPNLRARSFFTESEN